MPLPLLNSVWLYNSRSGSVIQETQLEADIQLKTGTGWHGPFSSKQAALDYYSQNSSANPGWRAPAGLGQAIVNAETGAAAAGASAAAKAVAGTLKYSLSIGNTTGLLTRILKVGIGLVLLVAGILKLTSTDKTLEQVLPLVGGPAGKVLRV